MGEEEDEAKGSDATSDDLANELEADLEKELAESSDQEENGKECASLMSF